MCAATDVGVHAFAGSSGSMVKPVASMVASTPPARGLVVHWPPHSTILAACQVGPGGMPCSSGEGGGVGVPRAAALDVLGGVPGGTGRHAVQQREGGGQGGVGGAAGQHHVGAG